MLWLRIDQQLIYMRKEREENVTGIHARYVVLLTMWKDTT